jgi:hypothetical protein
MSGECGSSLRNTARCCETDTKTRFAREHHQEQKGPPTEMALPHRVDRKATESTTIHPTMIKAATAPAVISAFSLNVVDP